VMKYPKFYLMRKLIRMPFRYRFGCEQHVALLNAPY
jgi:hypothetical protein